VSNCPTVPANRAPPMARLEMPSPRAGRSANESACDDHVGKEKCPTVARARAPTPEDRFRHGAQGKGCAQHSQRGGPPNHGNRDDQGRERRRQSCAPHGKDCRMSHIERATKTKGLTGYTMTNCKNRAGRVHSDECSNQPTGRRSHSRSMPASSIRCMRDEAPVPAARTGHPVVNTPHSPRGGEISV